MKKITLLFLVLISIGQIRAQQITNTFPDSIHIQTNMEFEILTTFPWNVGPPPHFCGDIFGVSDSLIGNTIIYDFYFEISGVKSFGSSCARWDTINRGVLSPGNYTLIGFWNYRDSIVSPDTTFRYASDTISIYVSNTTSIEKKARNSLSISPNPIKYKFKIWNKDDQRIEKIEIWDLTGKLIKSIPYDLNEIDVSILPNGIYVLKIISTDGSITIKKIVKSN